MTDKQFDRWYDQFLTPSQTVAVRREGKWVWVSREQYEQDKRTQKIYSEIQDEEQNYE